MNNLLENLNVQNGNNTAIIDNLFRVSGNPSLTCVTVDNEAWSTTNWTTFVDAQTSFSNDCDALSIDGYTIDDVRIFPNPTSNSFTISIPSSASYSLVNIFGQNTQKGTFNYGDNILNISHLSNGVYFLTIKTDKGSATKKIMKH